MKSKIEALAEEAKELLLKAENSEQLQEIRQSLLGKKSSFALASIEIENLSKEEKPIVGKLLNEAKQIITSLLEEKEKEFDKGENQNPKEWDFTLPKRNIPRGGMHPITVMTRHCISIFQKLGFSLERGPEVETEFYCFDALNTPKGHPAREEQDTFYLEDGHLLRTHTSSVQIRAMEKGLPPLRIISSGSVYRRDEIDATHLSQFHQLEGLYVTESVTLAELKGVIDYFFQHLFGEEIEMRLRPHFFPFTEPSFEIDLKFLKDGEEKWIEVAGCGMVNPNVFESVCKKREDWIYSPKKVSGFAFGMGIERLAMIRWGISNIRQFVENDKRFLDQFEQYSIYPEF